MSKYIDINCDLGEGIGNESELMPLISSCNIACGGHAGDKVTMAAVADLASCYDVNIGAHPSFPDKANFGRKIIDISPEHLKRSLTKQITDLKEVLKEKQLEMHHVKPHGALYNLVTVEKQAAIIVVDVIKTIGRNLVLFAPYGSVISNIALKEGLKIKFEAFADRNYNDDLTLVSRRNSKALIHDKENLFNHVFKMVSEGRVTTLNGVEVSLKADTFCVHGDGKNVVENLRYLADKLHENNIKIL